MTKIRVGIIGTGFGTKVQAPIMGWHEGYEVRALSSVFRGNLEEVSRETGIERVYGNWEEMLDNEELDLVSVVSSPTRHREMAIRALEKGLHVLCEKPMALGAAETKDMLTKLAASKGKGFINFHWRLLPVRRKIKEMIRSNQLGKIQYIKYQGSFSGYKTLTTKEIGWLGNASEGGGMLFAIGSHMIDSLMWWMGEKIADVYADLQIHVPAYHGKEKTEHRNADDAFQIIGHFESGTQFTADLFYSSVRGSGWTLEVHGTKGTLTMSQDEHLKVSYGDDFEEVQLLSSEPPSELTPAAKSYFRAFAPMLDLVYEAVANDNVSEDLPTFEDGHRVQLVLDAVRRSADLHAKVEVDYR